MGEGGSRFGRTPVGDSESEGQRLEGEYQALAAREAILRSLFMNLGQASCLDEILYREGQAVDYRVLDVNPAYEQVTGIDRDRAVGALGSELYGMEPPPFLDVYARVAETGDPESFDAYFEPLGKHLHVTASCPVKGMFSTVFFDITDRMRSEAEYRAVFNATSDAIFVDDADTGRILDVNDSVLTMYGFGSKEQALACSIGDLSANRPPYTDADAQKLVRAAASGTPQHFEWLAKRSDGSEFPVEVTLRAFTVEGQPRVLAVVRDITSRKKAREELEQNAALLRMAGKIARFGGWSVNVAEMTSVWSDEVAAIHEVPRGYTPPVEEGINFYAPEWTDRITEVFTACAREGIPYDEELEIITARGRRVWVRTTAEAIRDESGVITTVQGAFQDITERKRAEAAQREAQALFRTIYTNAHVGIALVSLDSRIQQANPAYCGMLGYREEELVGKHLRDITHPDSEPDNMGKQAALARGDIDHYEMEKRFRRKDGREVVGILSASLVRDASGNPAHAVGAVLDITSRKEAEMALRENEARFKSLFHDHAAVKLLIEPDSGRIADANRAAVAFYGWSMEELRSMRIQDINCLSPDEIEREMVAAKDQNRTFFEFRHRRADGSVRDVAVFSSAVEVQGKSLLHSVIHDVTAHKRSEAERNNFREQLFQAQKMESIGSLAGGVAHDFNNLLSVILNYTSFAIDSLHEQDPLRADLVEVKKAGDRAAVLTKQLLAFGRRQVLEPRVLDLNDVVLGLERMLRRILGEDVDIVQDLAEDLGMVLADPGQIEQVIMNLVVNARDAMASGGRLRIESSNVDLDDSYAEGHVGVSPGAYVVLAISDTGCGMDPVAQSRLFEPFFTTKEKGKGTGLGLSTAYGIVRQTGGSITAYSELGQGSTFKVYLPRLLEPGLEPHSPVHEGPAKGGSETILVVEDDETVRQVAARMLKQEGYQVLTASSGGEALLICEAHPGKVHLLLTDVVMPRMGGRELADRLRKVRPDMRVAFMSGYTEGTALHHGAADNGTVFIAKPFERNVLKKKVREALDRVDETDAE